MDRAQADAMVTRSAPRLLEGVALAAVLAWAGLLRMGWPGLDSFAFDEARVSLLALQMARGGQFVRAGIPSSIAAPNFPAFVWLMTLPYAIAPDPLIASLWVGMLGVLAVAGVWWLARQAWGPWSALTAALLLAGSPFGVLYSRGVWSQDLMPFMAVLWALAGLSAAGRGNRPALFLFSLVAGLAGQVHYSGIALLPASIWPIIRYRLWRNWPWLALGGACAVAAAIPFVYEVLIRTPSAGESFLGILQRPSQFRLDSFARWAEVGLGSNWEWLPLGWDWRWPPFLLWAQRGARTITGLLILGGLVGLVRYAWQARRRPHGKAEALAVVLLAWAVTPPLLFLRASVPVYHQYLLTALPALLLIAAHPAMRGHRQRSWRGPIVAGLALAVSLVQGAATIVSIKANGDQLHAGGQGTPLQYPRAAAMALKDGRPIYVHAGSDSTEYDGDAAGMSVLLWDYPHRIVDGRSALLLPPDGETAHLFFLFTELPAYEQALAHARIEERRTLPRRRGEPAYMALTVTGSAPSSTPTTEPIALANGAQLEGGSAERQGERWLLTTFWRLVGPLQEGRYHQFNHLYVAGGDIPLQVRDAPLSSAAWQEGDALITWATFDPDQPGPYWVEVGMYTFPEIERSPLVSATGELRTSIRLGPLE